MTSSIMDENSNMLDYNFLTNLDHEEPDILDEFLDQRVYDSLGTTTPVPVHLKQEPSEFADHLFEGSLLTNSRPSDKITTPGSDYLYVDPSQYHESASSTGVYTSPYERKPFTAITSKNASIDGDQPVDELDPRYPGFSSSQLSEHDLIRDELGKLKFGNHFMNPCPDSLDVPDASYLDFSPAAMASLPYKLELFNLPKYSRVETQIKLKFTLSPLPPNALLYIPQDLISKNKFCLNQPLDSLSPRVKDNLFYLDAYVLTSDLKTSCNICSRCIKREQKRASRIKAGLSESDRQEALSTSNGNTPTTTGMVKNNPNSWADESMIKKAIIFNCKEIMSFPPPSGLNTDLSKSLELSARIICYCRHHKESNGFKLLFVIKNKNNEVVAKHLSTPIIIMDRKKNTSNNKNEESVPNSVAGSSTNLKAMNVDVKMENDDDMEDKQPTVANSIASNNSDNEFNNILHPKTSSVSTPNHNHKVEPDVQIQPQTEQLLGPLGHPLSPNSIDESASEPHTQSEGRNLKRKKLSVDDSFNSSSNPMFNGSVNGFSPMSNSDTNTSTTNNFSMMKPNFKPSASLNQFGLLSQPGSLLQGSSQPTIPSIQRIIPAQGPIRGGIEVTLLGFNFRPGLSVKFGANQALATHCWSETTIVTYLPPATQPGQVLVSFESHEDMMLGSAQQLQIFTYTDDTDRQLIELALQIVGLKMNGKLEDAKNIARRIVGTDNTGGAGSVSDSSAVNGNSSTYDGNSMNKANIEWFDNAHKAVEELTKSDLSTEEILINFLSLVDLPNCPIIIPNWQLCNNQGQSLMHLSTLKNYSRLVKFLITHGCKIDIQDNQGLTPLFLASMCGHRDLIKLFIDCKSNWNLKLSNEKYLKDYCDLNVLDMFSQLEDECELEDFGNVVAKASNKDKLTKSLSLDSLNSMLTMSYGRHISKMVMEQSVEPKRSGDFERYDRSVNLGSTSYDESNYSSEFADSEFESNEDEFEETDDYDEEYDDDYDSESIHSEVSTTILRRSIVPEDASVEGTDESTSTLNQQGLWQKVKNVFNQDDSDALPSYDDLFPFGPASFHSKPKTEAERTLNESVAVGSSSSHLRVTAEDDTGNTSDSSEDLVISFINHPRKTVDNDKMLLFFWFPVLICIVGCFFLLSVMGYEIAMIEHIKVFVRDTIGNIMVGSERIARVFNNKDNARSVLKASYELMVE
ncbi:uncharacterized protein CANTADRAFT_4435 [Suhomyces tanzawaensis NRRL Y-17324]|uniref:IPT/TIG domain-containing protein n=1 Tax=Suhomyces tanzawaensis NRRL Y-17324 TaxID=984487 RepID=A0A1E4SSE9_9ASCO|nr:uncharacterized protein CANTADRAFT_4435 [Suhomyces tanzawaensis NRRL Y-17324]ODV82443.1 hypothetical protein CANTADRAFT_4435 [Suhomyces tanzawaensis NRRL Y-17324]